MAISVPSGNDDNNLNPVDGLAVQDGPTVTYAEGVYRGYPVRAQRHRTYGHWCGYITVPREHPWAVAAVDQDGRRSEPCELRLNGLIEVHGGPTYAEWEPGGMTVGFDCAHSGDAPPPWIDPNPWRGDYRDLAYVRQELGRLAEQAEQAEQAANA